MRGFDRNVFVSNPYVDCVWFHFYRTYSIVTTAALRSIQTKLDRGTTEVTHNSGIYKVAIQIISSVEIQVYIMNMLLGTSCFLAVVKQPEAVTEQPITPATWLCPDAPVVGILSLGCQTTKAPRAIYLWKCHIAPNFEAPKWSWSEYNVASA